MIDKKALAQEIALRIFEGNRKLVGYCAYQKCPVAYHALYENDGGVMVRIKNHKGELEGVVYFHLDCYEKQREEDTNGNS